MINLIIKVRQQGKSGHHIYVKDLRNKREAQLIVSDEIAKFYYVTNQGKQFWLLTNKDAPNEKVISLSLDRIDIWTEVISEGKSPIQGTNVIGNRIVLKYV